MMSRAPVFASLIAVIVLLGVGITISRIGRMRIDTMVSGTRSPSSNDDHAIPPTVLGMNLSRRGMGSTEWPMVDLIQANIDSVSVGTEKGWAKASERLQVDKGGHLISVPRDTALQIGIQGGNPLPVGRYDCSVSPGWRVYPFGDARLDGDGRHFTLIIDHPIPTNGVVLKLNATTNGASLSDFSCRDAAAAPDAIFNARFLADNHPFGVIRFMDWMSTNGTVARLWEDRPTPASLSQAGSAGMSIEYMVQLANEEHADPWFNMPLDADPEYYRAFATYVRDHLSPGLKAYVEVSNEVWNNSFEQARYATRKGKGIYPGATDRDANDFYYADRVRAVMTVWSEVFKRSSHRIVRVLSSQAANSDRAKAALSHLDTWRSVDMLAVAPYFSPNVVNFPAGSNRVDALFANVDANIDQAIGWARNNKAVATQFGLQFGAYEGGQGFWTGRPDLSADFVKFNHDPRIYDVYMRYLKRWRSEVGGLLVLFDSGSWNFGHHDFTGQPLSSAPKMRALVDFMTSTGQIKERAGASPNGTSETVRR